jgi:hypothetical protein
MDLPMSGEQQALATPIENEILSRFLMKFGFLRFSE